MEHTPQPPLALEARERKGHQCGNDQRCVQTHVSVILTTNKSESSAGSSSPQGQIKQRINPDDPSCSWLPRHRIVSSILRVSPQIPE